MPCDSWGRQWRQRGKKRARGRPRGGWQEPPGGFPPAASAAGWRHPAPGGTRGSAPTAGGGPLWRPSWIRK
eukprot:8987656-Alexandrium_andersonii.AAC.1